MTDLMALCSRDPVNELIAAECENLTGSRPDADGVAICRTLEGVRRAAYVRMGVRGLAEGESLDLLLRQIARDPFDAADFRIEFLRLSERNPVDRYGAIVAVANVLPGFPNLDAPKHRFLLAVRESGIWFGEIVTEPDHAYERHNAKPYRTSSSLPSRLARALVNLVAPPARTILDPCCGTGSILMEAQSLGLEAYGSDWNPRMVGMTRKNLAFFGYTAEVTLGDASACTRTADALVTDLPYGRFLAIDKGNILDILANAARLAPVAVVVAGWDMTDWFREAGYREIEVFRVKKRARFTRFVHRARSVML